MTDNTLREARRFLDLAEDEGEREERLYYIRQAHQLVIASEEHLEKRLLRP